MVENNADILLHGHTHDPYINKIPTPERVLLDNESRKYKACGGQNF